MKKVVVLFVVSAFIFSNEIKAQGFFTSFGFEQQWGMPASVYWTLDHQFGDYHMVHSRRFYDDGRLFFDVVLQRGNVFVNVNIGSSGYVFNRVYFNDYPFGNHICNGFCGFHSNYYMNYQVSCNAHSHFGHNHVFYNPSIHYTWFDNGHHHGYNNGYNKGYAQGFNKGQKDHHANNGNKGNSGRVIEGRGDNRGTGVRSGNPSNGQGSSGQVSSGRSNNGGGVNNGNGNNGSHSNNGVRDHGVGVGRGNGNGNGQGNGNGNGNASRTTYEVKRSTVTNSSTAGRSSTVTNRSTATQNNARTTTSGRSEATSGRTVATRTR